jgi:hypothetical protein
MPRALTPSEQAQLDRLLNEDGPKAGDKP